MVGRVVGVDSICVDGPRSTSGGPPLNLAEGLLHHRQVGLCDPGSMLGYNLAGTTVFSNRTAWRHRWRDLPQVLEVGHRPVSRGDPV
jgi:hypothetical protein